MIKQAVSNREKGDSDAAGFYNITTKDLMKNKGLTLDFDCDLSKIKVENGNPVETLKGKFLSLPKTHFPMESITSVVPMMKMESKRKLLAHLLLKMVWDALKRM